MVTQPNVVFLVLDSVRYDHTSVGGYHRDTTPNLQHIADLDDGVSFDTAIAHAKHTPKSVASILTGKYPAEHQLNYRSGSNKLDNSIPTVAEKFRDVGYATAGVSNNAWVSSDTNLSRGFEKFTLLPKSPMGLLRSVGVWPITKFLANIRRHSAGFQTDFHRHSAAFLLTSLIHKNLDELANKAKSFFLYAHYNETHRAYYPPKTWFDKYSEDFDMSNHDAGEFSMDVHYNLNNWVAQGCPFTDDQWSALTALYDTEIRYTDTFIGDLFQRIKNQFDDTIFIVTSDHGEHLGERGALAHRYVLDDALLRIPLVIFGLSVKSSKTPVQHSDVMRTVLELAGADASSIDGKDLRYHNREFAISQDSQSSLESLLQLNPDFDGERFFPGVDDTIPERTALRTDSYRYVRTVDGTEVLFEIPNESRDSNIAADRPDIRSELMSKLDSWFDIHPTACHGGGDGPEEGLSQRTVNRLKQMGYIDDDF